MGVNTASSAVAPTWLDRVLSALPQGRGLPMVEWERRHRAIAGVLWLHVAGIPAFGIAQGYSVGHSLLEASVLALTALVARYARIAPRLRSAAACIGLLTSSALLVHFSGGFIEFHFHFFVMIGLLTLYVDWLPFLLAVGYVLVHHGLVGVLDAAAVYNHPDAVANPWKWAGIHAGFVFAAGAASIFTWRVSEEEQLLRANLENVTEAALAKLPLHELLEELLSRITAIVRAEIAVIWLCDEGFLALEAAHGATVERGGQRMPVDKGFHGRVVETQLPAVQADARPEHLGTPLYAEWGVRALAGVPLMVEGELLGVLDLASSSPRDFSAVEIDLLQIVADRIAPAIDRARLYEREHEIATTLQRSLLPKKLPELRGLELFAHYLPAGAQISVGGDWYDALELPDGRVALVMGDVAGHGSEAAALMGQLRTGLRAYATADHSAAEVVRRLNGLLAELGPESMATLLYVELDLNSGRGQMVTAGHPPPIVVDASGSGRLLEGARHVPLGAVQHTAYGASEFTLGPGETLILYTDGLVERRGIPIDRTIDHLVRRVSSQSARFEDICRELIAAATTDGPMADDAAVLAAQLAGTMAPQFSVQLPADPVSIPAARRHVEAFLQAAGATTTESYEIVTSIAEACANAVQHAYGARDGSLWLSGDLKSGKVTITVQDSGRWRKGEATGSGGRGLVLMRALMDDVEIDRAETGTCVVLTRALDTADGAATAT